MAGNLNCQNINDVVTQIEESGVYKRHFWRNLANIVEDKAQLRQMKELNEGDTIDLAYRVEMQESSNIGGFGTVPMKSSKIKKLKSSHKQFP